MRNSNDIRHEYLQKCAQAGELQYKIAEFQMGLSKLNVEIQALNQEYSEVLAKKPEAPTAENTPIEGVTDAKPVQA